MSALLSTLHKKIQNTHMHVFFWSPFIVQNCFKENNQKYTMEHTKNLLGIHINIRTCLELHVSQKNNEN